MHHLTLFLTEISLIYLQQNAVYFIITIIGSQDINVYLQKRTKDLKERRGKTPHRGHGVIEMAVR
jgi:hypothetical protein